MYNKILVPLDGSKLSESSLIHVKAVAAGNPATEIVLLTVSEAFTAQLSEALYGATFDATPVIVQEESDRIRQKAKEYLGNIADALKKDGLVVRTIIKKAEANQGAAETIIDYAKDNKVDLIIMSTHGRSGISRWTLGSVTDKVIRHSGIPVLTTIPEGLKD